jgi:ClpP class serine protease
VSLVRFTGSGIYAILPSAFGAEVPAFTPPAEPFRVVGRCAVIDVCGPLTHTNTQLQTYASIVERAKAAAAWDVDTVAIRIASPGGDVYGAFDCSRAVAAAIRGAGKRYVAFTEAQACSSAYALASAADELVISDTATIGSIGVIATAVDTTRADAAMGVTFAIVTSGARKADGNPHVALSAETIAALKVGVDATAEIFFGLVAERRRLPIETVRGFEAGTFVGAAAVANGLADRIATWEELICELASGQRLTLQSMAYEKDKDETRKALAAAAEDKDPDKAARAKRALAAFDEDDKEAASEEDKGDEKEKEAAAAAAKASDEEKEKEKAVAAASAAASAGTPLTAAQVSAIVESQFAARDLAEKRAALLASRPDVAASVLAALANAPLDQIKAVLDGFPKAAGNPLVPQLANQAARGAGEGVEGDRLPKAEADAMSLAMGLTTGKTEVIDTAYALVLGATVPAPLTLGAQ